MLTPTHLYLDELNTLNIKLFPIYPAPPSIKAWQVPLFTVRFEAFMDENWDLTMQKVREKLFATFISRALS